MKSLFILILSLLLLSIINCYIIDGPGPTTRPTVGQLWPKPQKEERKTGQYVAIDPKNFNFVISEHTCDILMEAKLRYEDIIKGMSYYPSAIPKTEPPCTEYEYDDGSNEIPKVKIRNFTLILSSECEKYPHLKMDESYTIDVLAHEIRAHSIWGMLRGLESFSQLIIPDTNEMLQIEINMVEDYPRFQHRGLLVDTSRHYISVDVLKTILDGMAYNKFNVFHWHIVDDQSFPYVSKKFPELSEKGAYFAEMIYTQKSVKEVIEYARFRGIRVLPEFDVPGHTRSWGASHPEILTECGSPYSGKLGPLNPIKEKTLTFLKSFFEEVSDVFPDHYLHIGGDEVGFECWNSNEDIKKYVEAKKMTYEQLEDEFNVKAAGIVSDNVKIPIVWQEVLNENLHLKLPEDSIIQVWKPMWQVEMSRVTTGNWNTLLSSCWYLDKLKTGGDWKNFYDCEPTAFPGAEKQKQMVLGGEACMWAEVVNNANIVSRIFPRASATAEKLWSDVKVNNKTEAAPRLEEHTCRLINRGISAQPPNGAGFC
ncbi:HEXB.2 family protein [Megaselia abdita]